MPMSQRLLRPQATGSLPGEGEPATILVSGPFYTYWLSCKSTTGYVRVDWTTTNSVLVGTGNPATLLTASIDTYTEAMALSVSVYPCNADGTAAGALTRLEWSGYGLDSLNVSALGSLEYLGLHSSGSDAMETLFLGGLKKLKHVTMTQFYLTLISVNLSDCPALETLSLTDCSDLTSLYMPNSLALKHLTVSSCAFTNFDLSGRTALQSLDVTANPITSINVAGCTALTNLNGIYFTPLTSLNVTGCTALTSLDCTSTGITSLDVSGLTALSFLTAVNCSSLTSLRAVGFVVGGGFAATHHGGTGYLIGANIQGCALAAAALNQFYTDLATGSGGIIHVSGNPGTTADNPSIATAKGYIVYGS